MKLIEANEGNKRDLAPVELYHVAKDPREKTNLAGEADYAVHQQGLQSEIVRYQDVIHEGAAESTGEVAIDEVEDQMGALGYLE